MKSPILSSSLRMYLCSINHSICSLIIFFEGRNIFLRISTSSVWSWAFVIRFLIFIILTIASCVRSIRNWTILSLSSSRHFSVANCKRPMRLTFPLFWDFPFFLFKTQQNKNSVIVWKAMKRTDITAKSWFMANRVLSSKSFIDLGSVSQIRTWRFNLGNAINDCKHKRMSVKISENIINAFQTNP